MSKKDDTNVKVAVRVRPLNKTELASQCPLFTEVLKDTSQIVIGDNKFYTFDHVFDTNSKQKEIYDQIVHNLIEGSFDGYNATVIAYGQTGSGKTYSMGSSFDLELSEELIGIIPRALSHLYAEIEKRQDILYEVSIQFVELYNEEFNDLLDSVSKKQIKIHEDNQGGIYLVGTTTKIVRNIKEVIDHLKGGCLLRTTGSTNMNDKSSRSHAIFSLIIKQERSLQGGNSKLKQVLTSKLNFVDLAGSERLKRTGATGNRAKEGISINYGLFVLGNVISALADKSRVGMYVPYRDSKLTRILQDSLGGNSCTVMLACVSPAMTDWAETSGTLEYANRTKNIENKAVVNQDLKMQEIVSLRAQLVELRRELDNNGGGNQMHLRELEDELEKVKLENERLVHHIEDIQNEKEDAKLNEYLNACDGDTNSQKIISGLLKDIAQLRVERVRDSSESSVNIEDDEVRHLIDDARKLQDYQIQRFSDLYGVEKSLDETITEGDIPGVDDSNEVIKLAEEIDMREKLIRQIETSQQRQNEIESKYGGKIAVMLDTIKDLEKERDLVVKKPMSKKEGSCDKIREEYDRKIGDLKSSVERYKKLLRDKTMALKANAATERDLQLMKTELIELKRVKVNLMKKMREDSSKNRIIQVGHTREVTQLKRMFQHAMSDFRNLQRSSQQKDNMLKRKQFEIDCLKRKNKERTSANTKTSKRDTKQLIDSRIKMSDDWICKLSGVQVKIDEIERDIFSWIKKQNFVKRRISKIKENLAKIPAHKTTKIAAKKEKLEQLSTSLGFFVERINDTKLPLNHYLSKKNDISSVEEFVTCMMEGLIDVSKIKPLLINLMVQVVEYNVQLEHSKNQGALLRARISKLNARSSVRAQLLGDLVSMMTREDDILDIDLSLITEDFSEDDFEDSDLDNESEEEKTCTPKHEDTELLAPFRSELVGGDVEPVTMTTLGENVTKRHRMTAIPQMLKDIDVSSFVKKEESRISSGTGSSVDKSKMTQLESKICKPFECRRRIRDPITINFVHKGDKRGHSMFMNNVYDIKGQGSRVMALTATDDLLFSAVRDCNNYMLDIEGCREIQRFHGYPIYTRSLNYSSSLRTLVMSSDGCSLVFDIRESFSKKMSVLCPDGCVDLANSYSECPKNSMTHLPVCLSEDGIRFYYGNYCVVNVWDLGRRELLPVRYECTSLVDKIIETETAKGSLLLAALKTCSIVCFEVSCSGTILPTFVLESTGMDRIDDMSVKGGLLVNVGSNGSVFVWDILERQIRHVNLLTGRNLTAVQYIPYMDDTFVTGCRDGVVHLWNDSFQCDDSFKIGDCTVQSLATNSDCLFVGLDFISVWKSMNV